MGPPRFLADMCICLTDQLTLGEKRPQPITFSLDILTPAFFSINQRDNAQHLKSLLFGAAHCLHGGTTGGNHILQDNHLCAGRQVFT